MSSPSTEVCEDNSSSDSLIGRDFQELSAEEQERQREEWKAELKKTEEEILTLKQVLTAKERHAAGKNQSNFLPQYFIIFCFQASKDVWESLPGESSLRT